MKSRSSVVALVALICLTGQSAAQARGEQPKSVQLNFTGKTIGDLEAYLGTVFVPTNLVVHQSVRGVQLEPFKATVNSMEPALRIVETFPDAQAKSVVLVTTRTSDNTVIYTLTSRQQPPRIVPPDEKLVKTYAQVGADGSVVHLTGAAAQDVLRKMLQRQRADSAGVEFDSTTGVIIVTGTTSQIRMVDQFFDEVARARRSAASAANSELRALIRALRLRVDSLDAQVKELRRIR